MGPRTDPFPSQKHDPQEPCFQEEGSHNLVGQEGRKNVSRGLREAGEIRTEFEFHDDAGYHPDPEIDGEDFHPESVHAIIDLLQGF